MNFIEEETIRLRAFLVVLEDEKKDNMISKEAYSRLSAKLLEMLDRLEAERKKVLEQFVEEKP